MTRNTLMPLIGAKSFVRTPAPDAGTNGQQDADTSGLPDPLPVAQPRLFIANFAGASVTSYADPATVNGNIPPETNLQAAHTGE